MRAVTRPLERDVDLNGFARGDGFLFVRDGVGLAGRGVAARLPLDEVPGALAAIERDDTVGQPGCGPVALGVLPFQPEAPTELVVPAVTIGKGADGERWITTVDGASEDLDAPPPPVPTAGAFSVRPGVPVDTYLAAVAAGRDAGPGRPAHEGGDRPRHRGRGRSSRSTSTPSCCACGPRSAPATATRWRASSAPRPSSWWPATATSCARTRWPARPPAPATRAPTPGWPPGLMASTKNQVEHRVVIDVVHETLLPWCSYLDWEAEPSIVAVANVQHLGTLVEGRLSSPAPNVLEMARALSPTPALGGHPRAEALALIAEVEGFERGRYGGAVGWVDAAGNGTWAVAIRCAEITGRRARLFAGGGIVADSEPAAELAETQAKLQAMLSAIVRP